MAEQKRNLTSIAPAAKGEQNFVDLHRNSIVEPTVKDLVKKGKNGIHNAADKVKIYDRAKHRHGNDEAASIAKYDSVQLKPDESLEGNENDNPNVKEGVTLADRVKNRHKKNATTRHIYQDGREVGIVIAGSNKEALKNATIKGKKVIVKEDSKQLLGNYNVRKPSVPTPEKDDNLSYHDSLRVFADKHAKNKVFKPLATGHSPNGHVGQFDEAINETSTALLTRYMKKSSKQLGNTAYRAGIAKGELDIAKKSNERNPDTFDKEVNAAQVAHDALAHKAKNRQAGIQRATSKFADRSIVESEALIEADVVDLSKARDSKKLNDFHSKFMGDVAGKAREMMALGKKYHEDGRLPHPIGTKLTTGKQREHGKAPWEVTSHYVDMKDPENTYGYGVKRGTKDKDFESSQLMVKHSRLEKIHGPEKWKQIQSDIKPMGGLKSVKENELAWVKKVSLEQDARHDAIAEERLKKIRNIVLKKKAD